MKRHAVVLAVVLTSVFGLCAVDTQADPARRWSGPGWPDAYGPRFGNFAQRIAGTYLIRDGDAAAAIKQHRVLNGIVSLGYTGKVWT